MERGNPKSRNGAETTAVVKWSRVRLILSILTCEGLFATGRERVQYAPAPPRRARVGGAQTLALPRFYDYAGSLHVHSTYSDGMGTVAEIAHAANRAGLDFLVLCDHSSLQARQAGEDGWRGRTLVLVGTEIQTDTGHLLALDVPDSFLPASGDGLAAQRAILDSGGLGFIALPCDLKDHWRDFSLHQAGIGLEVFNLSAIARTKINLPALAEIWRRYKGPKPQKAFHLVSARPARELRLWDSLTAPAQPGQPARPVVGIGSVDAHAVMKFGGRAYPFPTYEETFRTLRTHVVTTQPLSHGEGPSPDRAALSRQDQALLHRSLAQGHCYMAYDNYADSTGFVFEAVRDQMQTPVAVMGDALAIPQGGLRLRARAPRTRSFVRLYCNGQLVAAARGGELEHRAETPGVYRVEMYLYRYRVGNLCLGAKPWIFSNPIYVQPAPVVSPSSSASSPGMPARQPQDNG